MAAVRFGTGPGTGVMARPLHGKTFYLDLPGGRDERELAAAIGRLGGVTESFLSKEVSYVVSSNKEAKQDKSRTFTKRQSNVSSECARATGPMPSTSKGTHTRPHQKPPDTVLISRGKELLQKAMKNQDTCSGSSILANARLWGVQILHVDEMLSYAQQLLRAVSGAGTRCQKTEEKLPVSGLKLRKGRLKPPFLKVEDQSRQFRPFHHQFKVFPELNFLAPKGSSPFEPLKSLSNSHRIRGAEGSRMRSGGEKSPQSTPVTVPKKRRKGFCECCQETFEELHKHLQSPQHQRFALDNSQYSPVDQVISQLTSSFVEQPDKVPLSCLAAECSVPPAPVADGIRVLTALREEMEWSEQRPVGLINTERDHGLESKGSPSFLPGDGVSGPREGGGLSRSCLLELPLGAGLAARGTMKKTTVEGTGLAPDLGQTHTVASCVGEVVVSSSEPQEQPVPRSAGHLPATLAPSRKRRLSSRDSILLGKKPRLELGNGLSPWKMDPVGSGMGGQGAGWMSEPALPGVGEVGSLSLGMNYSNRPQSSLGLDLCPCRSPGEPPSQPGSSVSVGFDPPEAAAAGAVRACVGRSRAIVSSPGEQLEEGSENPPRNVLRPDLESTVSGTSCPTGRLPSPEPPVAAARCCCLLCVRAAEKIEPELPDLPGQGGEQPPCPGLPQPLPRDSRAGHDCGSSEPDWDVHLRSSALTGGQDSWAHPADRDLLQRTHLSVRDSGYESQLCSVLKQKPELPWASKEDKTCHNCYPGTSGASFPIFETFDGSQTS